MIFKRGRGSQSEKQMLADRSPAALTDVDAFAVVRKETRSGVSALYQSGQVSQSKTKEIRFK